MKFRLKMTLCMLWLLALVFGAGGGALITLSLRTALLQAESASLQHAEGLRYPLHHPAQPGG